MGRYQWHDFEVKGLFRQHRPRFFIFLWGAFRPPKRRIGIFDFSQCPQKRCLNEGQPQWGRGFPDGIRGQYVHYGFLQADY